MQDQFLPDKLYDGLMMACQLHQALADARRGSANGAGFRPPEDWHAVCCAIASGLYQEIVAPHKMMRLKCAAPSFVSTLLSVNNNTQ